MTEPKTQQTTRIVSVIRDITIILAIIFVCVAAYKFMIYFSVWDLPPLDTDGNVQ